MPDITLEEMEAQLSGNAPTKAPTSSEAKINVSDLPDLQGKTVAELNKDLEGMRAALRISEDARVALKKSIDNAPAPPPPAEPVKRLPELTREQLKELASEDPLAVVDYMQQHLVARLDDHLNTRFKPIVEGNISSLESKMRAEYPVDFELFADSINEVKKNAPQGMFTTDQGWRDVLAYVRGQPGNIEKLIEYKIKKPTREAALTEQRNGAGFSATPTLKLMSETSNDHGLDATQLEICRVAGWDPAEYKRYM